jgi:pimeloyl-ACP methyl ester carboxylesterase
LHPHGKSIHNAATAISEMSALSRDAHCEFNLSESSLINASDGSAPRWPDGYFTATDGARLHYVEIGSGTPVILVHGARGSAIGNWFSNGIAPKLAETNKVYALDMRGHGLSDRHLHKPFEHTAMATDILEFMDQKGIDKAHMGGFSMGAFVLVQLMMMAPERFITCCLQGGGVRETPQWRGHVPPDNDGHDPDQDKAEALVRQRQMAKGAEIGNNFSDGPPWRSMGKDPPPEILERFRKRDEEIAALLTQQGHRSPKHATVLPSTVRIVRLRHRLLRQRSQSHPRRIPGRLTVPQLARTLKITPHWIYDRIHNGTIQVALDPATRLYLFPDQPKTIILFKQLRAGKLQSLRF